jgi:hypothetical protein
VFEIQQLSLLNITLSNPAMEPVIIDEVEHHHAQITTNNNDLIAQRQSNEQQTNTVSPIAASTASQSVWAQFDAQDFIAGS